MLTLVSRTHRYRNTHASADLLERPDQLWAPLRTTNVNQALTHNVEDGLVPVHPAQDLLLQVIL